MLKARWMFNCGGSFFDYGFINDEIVMTDDVRWRQRFSNFKKALTQLEAAVILSEQRELSDLEKQGLIQAFEFTHELAWNCLKDYLEFQGQVGLMGSRDVTRKAFELGLVEDGEGWMDMIQSRNRSSHTYNLQTMKEINVAILDQYYNLFSVLSIKLSTLL